jgi:hypothetical protein
MKEQVERIIFIIAFLSCFCGMVYFGYQWRVAEECVRIGEEKNQEQMMKLYRCDTQVRDLIKKLNDARSLKGVGL